MVVLLPVSVEIPAVPRTVPPVQSNPAPGLPSSRTDWALFLDVDGTLVEITESPDLVRVVKTLPGTLRELEESLVGALALISGRSLAEVDRLFAPHQFVGAGVHGAEIRSGTSVLEVPEDPTRLDTVRKAFRNFADTHPGTLWEDKRFAVTLHYRRNSAAGPGALALAHRLESELGEEFQVLEGKMVAEVRFRSATKANAIATMLEDAPFHNRLPVYVGDDRTDEDAFGTVNQHGGISIVVGNPAETQATHTLASVTEVHRWIDALAQHLQTLE